VALHDALGLREDCLSRRLLLRYQLVDNDARRS